MSNSVFSIPTVALNEDNVPSTRSSLFAEDSVCVRNASRNELFEVIVTRCDVFCDESNGEVPRTCRDDARTKALR